MRVFRAVIYTHRNETQNTRYRCLVRKLKYGNFMADEKDN